MFHHSSDFARLEALCPVGDTNVGDEEVKVGDYGGDDHDGGDYNDNCDDDDDGYGEDDDDHYDKDYEDGGPPICGMDTHGMCHRCPK